MSVNRTDVHALTYLADQRARRADRFRRRVRLCACGAEYTPTGDGRRQHQTLHGHQPCPPRPDGGDAA